MLGLERSRGEDGRCLDRELAGGAVSVPGNREELGGGNREFGGGAEPRPTRGDDTATGTTLVGKSVQVGKLRHERVGSLPEGTGHTQSETQTQADCGGRPAGRTPAGPGEVPG